MVEKCMNNDTVDIREMNIKAKKAKSSDSPVDVDIYHGIRYKDIDKLKKEGFRTYTPEERAENIYEALRYFNIDLNKLDEIERDAIESVIDTELRGVSYNVWASVEGGCKYARRNPEHVLLALGFAGVPDDKIMEYMRNKFGKPYKIKLKIKPTRKNIHHNYMDIPTGKTALSPEDIEEICECPDYGEESS